MTIEKRPSGGRGEYELAGQLGDVSLQDLFGRTLYLKYGAYGTHTTGIILVRQGGKPRLRRAVRSYIHIHRQVQAALLFPRAIRDESLLAGGQPTIMRDRYVVQVMRLASVQVVGSRAEIQIGTLELDNGSQRDEVDFRQRIARIRRLHRQAGRLPPLLRGALQKHKAILQEDAPIPAGTEQLIEQMMEEVADLAPDYDLEYVSGTDVLVPLEEILSLPEMDMPVPLASIAPNEIEIRVREAARWRRWAAARGSASAAFRRNVRRAYDSRCVVCGLRLPLSNFCRVPGVDSAHILPWADYDLDHVCNGLCLCKLHHWAFDQQLIAIMYDSGTYQVKVTQRARDALQGDLESLDELLRIEGPIPMNRFPASSSERPLPKFLTKLYEEVPVE